MTIAQKRLKADISFELAPPGSRGYKCSHCKFFRPLTQKSGRCIWPEVPADMDASRCAGGIFRPK